MDKQADSVFKKTFDYAKAHPHHIGAASGAIGGTALGGLGAHALNKSFYKSKAFKKMSPEKQREAKRTGKLNVLSGGIAGPISVPMSGTT